MTNDKLKILVTGGAGFIGSHLVDLLLSQNHQVVVLDNFSTGKLDNLPSADRGLSIVNGDIRYSDTVEQAATGCDAIVHLAAVASVQASVEDPCGTHQVNLVGTLNLLEVAKKQGIKRFVYASSAAVYGDTNELPVSEATQLNPLTPYAADKLAGEYYIDFYRRQYHLKPVIFRFFNIFGPRQDPSSPYSGVISIFLQRAQANQPITVFGDGEQTRDFVYVAELVRLLEQAVTTTEPAAMPMNVGNGKQTSLNQLLAAIQDFSSHPLDIRYSNPRSGDIRYSCADNQRVREQMGFHNQYPIADGLKRTWEWMRE
ncbi:NAD-dependent epimerase/dehydratase family protein [Pelovirga terrestris]|uniref:NAD-dependent epimerase/dehydratase family protein n=1 Tax=Pelovirga terrestris TaxID=2771352 RepID=A0A8J6QK14_9BACT|nr:NAD-dependent epimerase/dehydratase family protein [Pelovirga terrestris]MBD1399559.1 NAD-dependent epimerase/dehydratase family protein [Pelovirga terrestris]